MITIIFSAFVSALAWRRPVVGFFVFLLGTTGFQAILERYGLVGPLLGPLRADNIAPLVAVISLLRRPRLYEPIKAVELPLWAITCLMPFALAFHGTSVYAYASSCLRVMYWAPLYLALLRLREPEMQQLRYAIFALVALTGLLTVYLFWTKNLALYNSLSEARFGTALYEDRGDVRIESMRMVLPGMYQFGTIALFVIFGQIMRPKRQWPIANTVLLCGCFAGVLAGNMISLSRAVVFGVGIGLPVTVVLIFRSLGRSQSTKALIGVMLLVIVVVIAFASNVGYITDALTDRFGSAHSAQNIASRVESNGQYLAILTQQFSILSHPSFAQDDRLVGGYNDVIAPISIWWYFGLVPALLYIWIVAAFAVRLLRSIVARQLACEVVWYDVAAVSGLFICYHIGSTSGAPIMSLNYVFALTYLLAECGRATSRSKVVNSRPLGGRYPFGPMFRTQKVRGA